MLCINIHFVKLKARCRRKYFNEYFKQIFNQLFIYLDFIFKVLAIESQKKKQSLENGSLISEDGDTLNVGPEIIEKRTRFSLSQDQESVGNVSFVFYLLLFF